MRKEYEVMKEILDFAQEEHKVRVVMLNGSRLNFNAPKDIMQDYDVVFFVQNIKDTSYKTNREWINRFGELVILQQNDLEDEAYIFLMQFKDGVRIDLSFRDISIIEEAVKWDTLSKIILDKDDLKLELPDADDSAHYVRMPDNKEFDSVLNECWWIQTYVAKGIWRNELPLAKYMFDVILIENVKKLLSWHIGIQHDWNINVGKCGKWFKRLLPEEIYNGFVEVYPTSDYENMWQSLFKAGRFIRAIGTEVADELKYSYPMREDINVTEFLKRIKELPGGAEDFKVH
jgi:aminoglycoside 6-adenylyltransferase